MREIKFRGKRIDNGEWVEGCLTRYSEAMSYITVDLLEQEVYQVRTETVGQYTGLKDKNGKEIFEGDVVETRAGEHEQGVWQYGGVVTITDIRWLPEDLNYADEIEIIGNIHDQKSLEGLEG